MSVSYYKRYRMEIDLRGRCFDPLPVPPGYRLFAWHPDRLGDHADAKYASFQHEIDADVFECLGDAVGCYKLMEEISEREGFLPEATWLAAYVGDRAQEIDYAYSKADQEVGAHVPRPKNYRAGLVRAQSLFLQREGLGKNTGQIVELDKRSLAPSRSTQEV